MKQTFNKIIKKLESWFFPAEKCNHLWTQIPDNEIYVKCSLCGRERLSDTQPIPKQL